MSEGESRGEKPPDPVSTGEDNRANLIDLAVKFLNNPRVQSSPIEQKRAFLKKKGLTDAEIEKAVAMVKLQPPPVAASNQLVPSGVAPPLPPRPPVPPPRSRSWGEYAAMAVVLGGVGYAAVQLFKRFVLPWLERRSRTEQRLEALQETVQDMQANLSQSVAALSESTKAITDVLSEQTQQLQLLGSALPQQRGEISIREVKDEITSLKGLLLNRHQFPPTPTRQGSLPGGGASGGGGIPSWQRVTPAAKTDQTGLPNGTPEKPLEEQTNGGSGAESSSSPEGEKVRGKKASNGGPPPVPVVGKLNSSDEENMQEWHDAPN